MPQVTGMTTEDTANIFTVFSGSINDTNQTFTFTGEQNGMTFRNKGDSIVTLAVDGKSYKVPPKATIEIDDQNFDSFDAKTASGTQNFEITSFQRKTGTGVDSYARAQLAQTEKKTTDIFSKSNSNRNPVMNLSTNKALKPIVTFIDDDGNRSLLTKLKPISERQGVPFVGAFVGDALETGLSVTTSEALDLQNRLGWEIASHSQTHLGLQTVGITDAQIEYETKYSSEFMRARGLDVKNFVYPGGQYDDRVKRIVSKYYNSGVGTDARINTAPHITYNLGRLAFPQPSPNNTLAFYKSKVDEAVANNSWLIWMMHCGQSDFTLEQEQILEDLILYIKSINVEILTVQQALDKSGNIISVNDNQFYMNADGKNNMVNYIVSKRDTVTGVETINPDMLPSNFELGKTYTSEIFTTNMRAKFPTNKPGVFTVVMTHNVQQSYQRFLDTDGAEFVRYATASNTWGSWKRFFVGDKLTVSLAVGSILANSSVRKTVTVNGLSTDTLYIANPKFVVPSGIVYSCTFVNSWVLGIEFFNSSGSAVDVGTGDWNIFMVK